MSIYGFLNCHDCRQMVWLGKAMHEQYRPIWFHIGPADDPPNWQRDVLNQVIWKFLADHCSHRIDVRLESQMTEEMYGYQDIGGDGETGISDAQYLAGWRGLRSTDGG